MPNKLEEKDWKFLLSRIKRKEYTLFLGAGACCEKNPIISQIASDWAKKYDFPVEDSDDLILMAQFVAMTIDDMAPKEEICKKIDELLKEVTPKYFETPDKPYGVPADSPLPVYITTTYDDLMMRALKSRGKTPVQEYYRWHKSIKKHKRTVPYFDPIPEKPLVNYLHGTYEEPESLVLTEDDYLDFLAAISREQKLPLPPRIQETLTTKTLIFLGYRIADWDFRILFRLLDKYSEISDRKHFYLLLVPGDVSTAQKEKAQKYLNRYFTDLDVPVYRQDYREFAAELRIRWEAFNSEI